MSFALREYQTQGIRACYSHWRKHGGGGKGAMLVLSTGLGKTVTAMKMVEACIKRGGRALWLAGQRELIHQAAKSYTQIVGPKGALDVGVFMGGKYEADKAVVCATVQTMVSAERRREYLQHGVPRLVVIDECHGSAADSVQSVLEALKSDQTFMLGLTATPAREDRKSLAEDWDIVFSRGLIWSIANNYLVPFKSEVVRLPKLKMPADAREDFSDDQWGEALLEAQVVEHTTAAMQKHAKGRTCLLFSATIAQAQAHAEHLNENGFTARWVSGSMPRTERDAIIRSLREGKIDVVCNAQLLAEGFDAPRVDCIVVARPTGSKVRYIQTVGRGLRLFPGKEDCLILDIAGASEEHDLIMAPLLLESEVEKEAQACALHPDGQHRYIQITDYTKQCECGREITNSGETTKSILEGLLKKRHRTKATWLELKYVDRQAFVCDCGEHGVVYVTQDTEDDSLYWCHHLPPKARKPRPLAEIPVDIGLAYGIGDDVVRRASALVKPSSKWRQEKPSEKQKGMAAQMGVYPKPGMTRGELSDLITKNKSRARAIKAGLVRAKVKG